MKVIDTKEYVTIFRELVESGEEVSMRIAGNSMAPFLIHERDYIHFEQPSRPLKVGDMVFYQRKNGQFIMHRIYKVKPDGYYMAGDAQTMIEGPIEREQIFALITKVRRKGKWILPGNFWWEFFAHIWIHMIPVRHVLMGLYTGVSGKRRKQG